MAKLYELWDGETGNLIGAYASEQEALAAVSDAVRRRRPWPSRLRMSVGKGGAMASEASLAA